MYQYLIFTHSGYIKQILMTLEFVHLLPKQYPSEFIYEFNYQYKLLICHSIVILWIYYYPREQINRFIILTDNMNQLFIRGISMNYENNLPVKIIQKIIGRYHMLDLFKGHL